MKNGRERVRGCRLILDAATPLAADPGMHRLGVGLKPRIPDADGSPEFSLNPDAAAYVDVLQEVIQRENPSDQPSQIHFVYANRSGGGATWLAEGSYSFSFRLEGMPLSASIRLAVVYAPDRKRWLVRPEPS
jgi:hypothetical protein